MISIKLYVGIGNRTEHNVRAATEHALKVLSANYGGATLTESKGAWVDGEGKLIVEPALVFETVTANEPVTAARGLAQWLAWRLTQDSVLLTTTPLNSQSFEERFTGACSSRSDYDSDFVKE